MQIFSQEMMDALKKKAEDPTIQKKFPGLTISAILVVTDCPGNEDKTINIDIADAKLRELTMQVKPAPSDLRKVPFDKEKYIVKISGPYSIMADVFTGKAGPLTVLDKLNIDGSLMKILRKLQEIDGMIKIIKELPLEV